MSHPGLVRKNNEDVCLVGELVRTLLVRDTNVPQPESAFGCHRGYVFLVADGVGGNEAGEVASRLSTSNVEEFLLNMFRRFTALNPSDEQVALAELQHALLRADARLFDEAHQHPEWFGMGTTLTMAFGAGGRLFVAHASQIGPDVQAAAAVLHTQMGLSHGKVASVFRTLFGISLTRGASAQIDLRAAARLEPDSQLILGAVRSSEQIAADETG